MRPIEITTVIKNTPTETAKNLRRTPSERLRPSERLIPFFIGAITYLLEPIP